MRRKFTAAALLLALAVPTSAAAEEAETLGQLLVSMPLRLVDPLIAHCVEHVPAVGNDLLEERAAFVGKLAEAGRPLVEKFGSAPEFNAPVEDGVRQRVLAHASRGFDMLRQEDPVVVCRRALGNMQGATVEGLSKVSEDNYRYFLGIAREAHPAK